MVDIVMKPSEFKDLSADTKKRLGDMQALRLHGYWLQMKYDGCFGMVVVDRRADGTLFGRMLSRTAEDYSVSCDHIVNHVVDRVRSSALEHCLPVYVLGEVWIRGSVLDYISGRFRQRHEVSPDLCFVVNDIVGGKRNDMAYSRRILDVYTLFGSYADTDMVSAVATLYMDEWEGDPMEIARLWIKSGGGFDGAILRDPSSTYSVGRAKDGQAIKAKPTVPLDLKCIDTKVKPGAKTGRDVLTIQVEYQGVSTWVGSGVPHDLTADEVIGQIVEVEYRGITPGGKLREPRFKRIRFDKKEPD